MLQETTKLNEVDCSFVRQQVTAQLWYTPFVMSKDQLAGIFSNALLKSQTNRTMVKLRVKGIYAPA